MSSSLVLSCSPENVPFLFFFLFGPLIYRIPAVVSTCVLSVFFTTIATCLWRAGKSGGPSFLILFSFLVLSFYDVLFLIGLLPIDLSAVVSMGVLCVFFPTIATGLWPAGESGVPSSLIQFSFLVLSFYDVPSLSFSSMFPWLTDPSLLWFPRAFCIVSPHYSHMFVTWVRFSSFFPLLLFCSIRFLSLPFFPYWRVVSADFFEGEYVFGSGHNCKTGYTSSTAQGGGGSFKNRKPIGEVGCCESRMAERIHWWTDRWLELCFLEWLQRLQWSPYHNCWMYCGVVQL